MIDSMPISYPKVRLQSIPAGNLLAGNLPLQFGMDKFEKRRIALVKLISGIGHGGIKRVADKIGKSESYVSRMQYESTKKGAKGIGEDSVDALNEAFPGWLVDDSGVVYDLPERKPEDKFSPLALLLAQVFDMIPESDLIGRAQVFSSASIEIRALLDAAKPQAPADSGKK